MNNKSARSHGDSGYSTESTDVPEPSHAERARTLAHVEATGALSTMSSKHSGFPFGSVMPYAMDPSGSPVFLISSMAMHTRNLVADARATLLVVQTDNQGDVLGAGRVSIMGKARRVDADSSQIIEQAYLARHPNAKNWIHYGDFSFFRMQVMDIYFVGGFGVMGWVSGEEFLDASPDPLAEDARDIIQHMNEHHAESMCRIVKNVFQLKANGAQLTSMDRLGINLRIETNDGVVGKRVAFPTPASQPDDVRKQLMSMAGEA